MDLGRVVLTFVVAGAELTAFVAVLGMIVYRRGAIVARWRPGLVAGAGVFLASLPGALFSIAHLDPTRIAHGDTPFMTFFVHLGAMLGIGLLAAKIPWHGAAFAAAQAQWDRVVAGGFAGPLRGAARRRHRLLCLLFGVACGVASILAFRLMGTEEGQALQRARSMFPGAEKAPVVLRLFVSLSGLLGIAFAEEITFRGCIQGLMLQAAGRRPMLRALAVALASLLWTLLHVFNTTQPLAKCAQIFVLGLAFGELARRHGFDRAVLAHWGLNLAAGIHGFL